MSDYFKHKDDYHMVVLYEDILEDSEREAQRLFKVEKRDNCVNTYDLRPYASKKVVYIFYSRAHIVYGKIVSFFLLVKAKIS
jgi:hypothetical protein